MDGLIGPRAASGGAGEVRLTVANSSADPQGWPQGWNGPEIVTPPVGPEGFPDTLIAASYDIAGSVTTRTGYTLGPGTYFGGAGDVLSIGGTLTLQSPGVIDGSTAADNRIDGPGMLVNDGLIRALGVRGPAFIPLSILTIGGPPGAGDLDVLNDGTIEVAGTFSQNGVASGDGAIVITASLDPASTGVFEIGHRGTLEIASDPNHGETFDFRPDIGLAPYADTQGGGLLIIDNPGTEFHDALLNFSPQSGRIDVRGIGKVGTALLDPATHVLTLYSDAAARDEIYRFTDVNADDPPPTPGLINLTAVFSDDVACFAAGTRIASLGGEIAVERLRPGDLVETLEGMVPVRWIGRRRIDLATHPLPERARPVRIAAGAFGPDAGGAPMPRRDILLSADHALFIEGMLVPAGSLINGTTIRPALDAETVSYFHIELDRHGVLRAEGLPAESWLDTGNRGLFDNCDEAAGLGALAPGGAPFAAKVEDGAALAGLRARLAARAACLGFSARVETEVAIARPGLVRARLPAGPGCARLVCTGAHLGGDRRRLGALVSRITLDGVALPLTGRHLERGFHLPERHGDAVVCWTDGDAVIAPAPAAGERVLEVGIAAMAGGV
jgi:hypothetical protein